MAKNFGHALFLLFFILVVHASSCEQEDYWKMKLPNVPMPPAIKENLLHPHDNVKEKVKLTEVKPSTIDSKVEKLGLNQPYTVGAWLYDADNVNDKAKATEIKPSTIDTKVEKLDLSQPYTVGAWIYDADNVKDKAKTAVIKPSTIDTSVEKLSLNQPYTVGAWLYDADNVNDKAKTFEIKPSTGDTKVEKLGLSQPYTVGGWLYNADNVKDKEKVIEIKPSTRDTKVEKLGLNQPYTVGAWLYDANNVKDNAEVIKIKPSTRDTKVEKLGLNQPYTVGGWLYNADNVKDKAKVIEIKPSTRDTKVEKLGLNQPYTVGAWLYDANNVKDEAEVLKIKPSTRDTKVEKLGLNQPYTVGGWIYNVDNVKDKAKVIEIKPSTRDTKVEKLGLNQPYTVGAWLYDANNVKDNAKEVKPSNINIVEKRGQINKPNTMVSFTKEEDYTENSHHHIMHNNIHSDDTLQDLSAGSVFFVEKSLHLGMVLKHDFQKTPKTPFLPRHIAQSIPFSDDKISEIIGLFSIEPDSTEARAIKGALGVCLHRPNVAKENRTCAQSMEDVVDFVVRELGTNDVVLRMMKNDIEVINGIKDYVITKVKKLVVPGNNAVACHRLSYPYIVYYCHHQQDIGHYDVTLVSPTSGTAIQTTAVCHYDTYAWQADVPALKYLGIRPGDAPVCHFSAINDMFWTIKDNTKSLDMAQ